MKKIYISIFLLYLILSKGYIVNAQVSKYLFPGVNCGVPNDISKSKCCVPMKVSFKDFFSPPDFGSGFSLIRSLILGPARIFLESTVGKYFDDINSFQDKVFKPCLSGEQSTLDPTDMDCRCIETAPTPGAIENLYKFCDNLRNDNEKTLCNDCVEKGGVWTSISCIQGDIRRFISETLFGWGLGLAGGISLLCIIYAAFMMQTSQGSPEKLKKAQELLTSCIMGLILIIFSIFILRLIGVNILKIPGFL